MPVGMEIINSTGSTVLDQNYKTMQMVSKVPDTSFTSSLSGSGIYQRRNYSYTFPYTDCVYAVSQRSGNTTPIVMSVQPPGASTTVVNVSCYGGAAFPAFDVFAFRPGGGGPVASGAGFEVYNADSSLGFGSGYNPLRVLSQFVYRYDTNDPGAPTFFDFSEYAETHVGKRVACLFSAHARGLDGNGTLVTMTTPVYTAHFVNNPSINEARLTWVVTGNNGKDLPYWERKGRYMFIDVSNF